MATWLKQSTAVEIAIGPFLNSSDGNTVESALTITQPDIRLKKNGGAWAQKSAAQTLTHEENGWYEISLSTTDTDTLGILIVAVHESGALPVWREFNVVPANVYDSLFSTDLLQVDVTQWLGVAPNALVSNRVDASTGAIANNVITDASIAASAIADLRSVAIGTADSGTTTTVVDTERTESAVDHWKGCVIVFSSGLVGQTRLITAFNPTTDTITFAPATTAAVTAGTSYEILPAARSDVHLWAGSAVNALISGRVDGSVGAMAADVLTASAVAAGAIDDDAVAADMDSYSAKVWIIRDGTTTDRYGVGFFKNGQPVLSGVTSPTIQVIKASDGTDLIASTALTEIGSTGLFKKDEGTNKMTAGQMYFAKVQATIDGSTRTHTQQVGRDA